ncbi:T9SS type A sorting domain-containing protein [Flavobacterium sp. GCM10023249]|uniref:T9SS type A sorting domain-containing protein n=1 Tax=unclassified Flavobacterium TaxID=196869 RepID=UPI00361E5431
MKKILLLTCFFGFYQAHSQELRVKTGNNKTFQSTIEESKRQAPNGIVRCASVEHHKARQVKGQILSDEQFEQWIAPKVEEIRKRRESGRALPSVIRIPVVVHVIHNGDAVGTNENIADAQVLSQITVLNQDFRRLSGTPGFGAGVDTSIEFCLAQVDPNGNPTNGIHRVNLGVASFNEAAVETNMKPNTIWDPTKYFNMWTANFGGDLDGTLGYAQFPTGSGLAGMPTEDCIAGEASTDGLIMAYNVFGSRAIYPGGNYMDTSYDKGRTATHEIGHMFGLRHIWGDTNCGTDYCADTPTAHTANYGCPTVLNCDSTGNEMVQNYMDYTDDACMSIFTQNQKDRMLAVLMNSPRRDDLLVSTVCSAPQASIQFKRTACETRLINADVTEGNGCSFTEYTVPLSINKAPTANAVVTFAVDGSSVANASDITIMTPTVTFNSGSIADKNLVFRVLNDGVVEPNENLVINFTVNANGGDAFANAEGNKLTLTILNDDTAPLATQAVNIFSQNFETPPSITNTDRDGDGRRWLSFAGNANTAAIGLTGNFQGSRSWDNLPSPNGTPLSPDNLMTFTTPIVIPSGTTELSFRVGAADPDYFAENYSVYLTTSNVPNTIVAQPAIFNERLTVGGVTAVRTVNVSSFAGQTVYLSFRHHATTDMYVLVLDDVAINNFTSASVQTAVNSATQYQSNLSSTGTAYAKDSSTSRMMVDINNTSNFNYGCTNVFVSRDQATAGAAAVNYGTNTANNLKVMAKTFTITPTTNNATGNATLKFYFSEAEIAAWESATGNSRTALRVIKQGDASALSTTAGTFGTNTTLTANVANGIGGVYYFGVQNTLDTSDFEFDNFALYPNPNKGNFTVRFNPETNDKVNINVYDLRGRQIFEKAYVNNGAFNQEINLDKAQTGVYLITIANGDKRTVKRIVIE